MQQEDGHKDGSRTSRGGTVKKAGPTHTRRSKHSAVSKLSEKRTRKWDRKMCSTSQAMASWSEKKRCCRVCDEQEENEARESSRNARSKTRRDMDMRRSERNQERRPGGRQLAHRFGHHEARCIENRTSAKHTDQCGQTSGTGHDVILTKNQPHIVNMETGEIMPLKKDGDMFNLDMWIWVPPSRSKAESCSRFAR